MCDLVVGVFFGFNIFVEGKYFVYIVGKFVIVKLRFIKGGYNDVIVFERDF